ncbi:MAG: hypothetical protein ACM3S2_11590 [Ignavibacteriales bacterium]
MKTIIKLVSGAFFTVVVLLLSGCNMHNPSEYNYTPPEIPTGVYSINGDNRVDIYWDNPHDKNVAGFNVYYSSTYDGKYTQIGSTESNHYIDYDAKNGDTYYYAVASYDYDGNESDLSYEDVHNTPRPEGFNQVIFDYRKFPDNSGYTFTSYSVVPYDDKNADFFFEYFQGKFYLDVYEDSDIQDLGPTRDIWDIQTAPVNGWSPTKDTTAVVGHTYIIWTWDNHYAKVRISNITNERITFDWAFQTVKGNRQLKRAVVSADDRKLGFDASKHHRSLK